MRGERPASPSTTTQAREREGGGCIVLETSRFICEQMSFKCDMRYGCNCHYEGLSAGGSLESQQYGSGKMSAIYGCNMCHIISVITALWFKQCFWYLKILVLLTALLPLWSVFLPRCQLMCSRGRFLVGQHQKCCLFFAAEQHVAFCCRTTAVAFEFILSPLGRVVLALIYRVTSALRQITTRWNLEFTVFA